MPDLVERMKTIACVPPPHFSRPDARWAIRAGVNRIEALESALATVKAEAEKMREALEIIVGKRPCIDNLMSNVDVALWALKEVKP